MAMLDNTSIDEINEERLVSKILIQLKTDFMPSAVVDSTALEDTFKSFCKVPLFMYEAPTLLHLPD